MPSKNLFLSIAIGSLGWLAFVSTLHAQEPETFSEVVDVRVVNLEVVATENGQRVHGLKPADFVLRVDGKEVPIEFFSEVVDGMAAPMAAAAAPDAAASSGRSRHEPGQSIATHYLVFIDEYFSIRVHLDRVLNSIAEQLVHLSPSDRMAIVAFNGKHLEMLSTWSGDAHLLTRKLRAAQDRPSYGIHRVARTGAFRSPGTLENQVERTVTAASSTLRSFAKPQGRKVMLLLSGGWPNVTLNRTRRISDEVRSIHSLRPLVDAANRLSYTVYPVDVPGVSATMVDVSSTTVGQENARRRADLDREQREETVLFTLARETGGRAWINSNNTRALQRVVDDTRSYYWLGFSPRWKGDDSRHRVTVTSRRKGLEIRTRGSFSDLSKKAEVSMMVESALLFGDLPNAGRLEAWVGRGKRAGFGKREVPIAVKVPLGALTFLPIRDGWQAIAELRVAVLDKDGATSDIPVIPMVFTTPQQPDSEAISMYKNTMKLRNQAHDLVVSVYDQNSGQVLTTKIAVPGR